VTEERIESAAEKAFKRRFGGKDKGRNKREDYALDLFREATAYLDDPDRVNAVLRELGKLYNPVTNTPIVDLETRQRVVTLLREGARELAAKAIDNQRRLYAPLERDDNAGLGPQEQWDTK